MVALTPVTWVRLKKLKASPRTSILAFSPIGNRRETRRSRYWIDGWWKALRGSRANRCEPPEPFTPPPGVLQPLAAGRVLGAQEAPLKPNEAGAIEPVRLQYPGRRRER